MCFKFGKVEGADGIFLVFFMFSLRNSGWKSRPHPHRNSKLLHSKIIYILLSNRTNKQLHFRLILIVLAISFTLKFIFQILLGKKGQFVYMQSKILKIRSNNLRRKGKIFKKCSLTVTVNFIYPLILQNYSQIGMYSMY